MEHMELGKADVGVKRAQRIHLAKRLTVERVEGIHVGKWLAGTPSMAKGPGEGAGYLVEPIGTRTEHWERLVRSRLRLWEVGELGRKAVDVVVHWEQREGSPVDLH